MFHKIEVITKKWRGHICIFLNQKFRKTFSDYGAYKDYFGPLLGSVRISMIYDQQITGLVLKDSIKRLKKQIHLKMRIEFRDY